MKIPAKGIHIRAIIGSVVVCVDLLMVLANHVRTTTTIITREELILHGLLLVAGLLLIAPSTVMDAWSAVKDKIPVIGAKK